MLSTLSTDLPTYSSLVFEYADTLKFTMSVGQAGPLGRETTLEGSKEGNWIVSIFVHRSYWSSACPIHLQNLCRKDRCTSTTLAIHFHLVIFLCHIYIPENPCEHSQFCLANAFLYYKLTCHPSGPFYLLSLFFEFSFSSLLFFFFLFGVWKGRELKP